MRRICSVAVSCLACVASLPTALSCLPFAKGVTDNGKSHVNFGDLPPGGYIERVIGEGRVRLKDGACLVAHSEVCRRTGDDKAWGEADREGFRRQR